MYKIYIVEDDKGIAEGIEGCLKNWGMEGRIVSDFTNVIQEISTYEPHLVILFGQYEYRHGNEYGS